MNTETRLSDHLRSLEERLRIGVRTLVVEDDEFDLLTVDRILEKLGGFNVVEARDGQSAINILHACKFDLVFLDLKLDGSVSGLDVLSEAKTSAKFIVLTGADERDPLVSKALNLIGTGMFIRKPITSEKLSQFFI